jgi:hypothetical protein
MDVYVNGTLRARGVHTYTTEGYPTNFYEIHVHSPEIGAYTIWS